MTPESSFIVRKSAGEIRIQWNLAIVVFKGQAILSHYNKRPLFRNNGLSHYSEIPAQTTKAKCLLPNGVLISDRVMSLGLNKRV